MARVQKKITYEKINELLHHFDHVLFEPESLPQRGRPSILSKKKKTLSSTQRDPSSFEIAEASQKSDPSNKTTISEANEYWFDLNSSPTM